MGEGSVAKRSGAISEPVTVLVERVSDAVGGLLKPWQIKRVAQANSDAALILAKGELEVTDLQRRTGERLLVEEMRKQEHMEQILSQAIPHIDDETASPQDIDQDWIANFFERGRLVSDQTVRELWARILAGEANVPGSFSRKTINILDDLGKQDAHYFTNLCKYVWMVHDENIPLILDSPDKLLSDEIYKKNEISFDSLSHLDDAGLIRYDPVTSFALTELPAHIIASYYGNEVELQLPGTIPDDFLVGTAIFTRAGEELYKVFSADTGPVDGFYERVRDDWVRRSLTPSSESA